jgi:hypothetical protein
MLANFWIKWAQFHNLFVRPRLSKVLFWVTDEIPLSCSTIPSHPHRVYRWRGSILFFFDNRECPLLTEMASTPALILVSVNYWLWALREKHYIIITIFSWTFAWSVWVILQVATLSLLLVICLGRLTFIGLIRPTSSPSGTQNQLWRFHLIPPYRCMGWHHICQRASSGRKRN